MKNKLLVATLFALFSQATCWAGIGRLTGKQFIDLGTKFLIIFVIFIILPMGIAFYQMNKRFVARHPELQGRYFWSLLFFPLFIIVILGVSILSSFILTRSMLTVVVSLGLFIYSIVIQAHILNNLVNWHETSAKKISRDILIMVILPPVNLIIGNYLSYNMYEYYFGSVWSWVLVEVITGGILWACVKMTLTQIEKNISWKQPSNREVSNSYYEVPQSLRVNKKEIKPQATGTEQLLKLKEMFDEGLISQKEFEKMKNEIINKNN